MTIPSFADHVFLPWRAEADRRIVASESHWREPIACGVTVSSSVSHWLEPLKWNDESKASGQRRRVLCGCDLFECYESPLLDANQETLWVDRLGAWRPESHRSSNTNWHLLEAADVRQRIFDLIPATSYLDLLIATEKPENFVGMIPRRKGCPRDQPMPDPDKFHVERSWSWPVWLGVIVSTQAEADARIPALLKVPAAKRWVWCRDVKEDINVKKYLRRFDHLYYEPGLISVEDKVGTMLIDWLVISGSTGPDVPPTDLAHIRLIVRQGKEAGVPVWVDGVEGEEWPKQYADFLDERAITPVDQCGV